MDALLSLLILDGNLNVSVSGFGDGLKSVFVNSCFFAALVSFGLIVGFMFWVGGIGFIKGFFSF